MAKVASKQQTLALFYPL